MQQTRREFIASTAALGVTAALPIGQIALPATGPTAVAASATAPVSIPWNLFANQHSPYARYCLETPFVKDGYLYATDSRIMIRQSTSRPDTKQPDAKRRFPPAGSIWQTELAGDWQPWPDRTAFVVDPSEYEYDSECPRCGGNREAGFIRNCSACEGEGLNLAYVPEYGDDELSREFGPFKKCDACGGRGGLYRETCSYCEGGRKSPLVCYQPVGPALINAWYDLLIRNLPPPVEVLLPASAEECIFFRFSGGEGAVMPCTPREDLHARILRDYTRKDSECLC